MKTMDLKMSLQCVIADPLIIRCFSHLRACQTQPDIFITVFQIKIVFVTSSYGLIIIVTLIITILRTLLAKEKKNNNKKKQTTTTKTRTQHIVFGKFAFTEGAVP